MEGINLPIENAINQILDRAVEGAKNSMPFKMETRDIDGTAHEKAPSEFFDDLSSMFVKNGLLNNAVTPSRGSGPTLRAAAFTMRAINYISASERIKASIADFFGNKENDKWFAEQGITDEADKEKLGYIDITTAEHLPVVITGDIDAGVSTFKMTYTGTDISWFTGASGSQTLTIEKAIPSTVEEPSASAIDYGEKLSESELSLENWSWQDGDIIPHVSNNGYVAVIPYSLRRTSAISRCILWSQ